MALIAELAGDRRHVVVEGSDFAPLREIVTSYPPGLIEAIEAVKGAYVCDEIAREEDPSYIELSLRNYMLPFVAAEGFAGKRLLDFGCGAGASTLVLARMFPTTSLVGIDLEARFVEVARRRAAFRDVDATLLVSPSSDELPEGFGTFDFVLLNAVWEHLLPAERPVLAATLWSLLRPGGVLLVNQTPYRWHPLEYHTTSLPFVNYLPAFAAKRVARLSPRIKNSPTWSELQREGIRGGTEREVLSYLPGGLSLKPRGGRAAIWLNVVAERPMPQLHRTIHRVLARVGVIPDLVLAIQKSRHSYPS